MSLCPPLSIIDKYVANGDIAPVSCVKKRRGGVLLLTSMLSVLVFHRDHTCAIIGCHVADGDVAPASRVNTGKRERSGSPESIVQ